MSEIEPQKVLTLKTATVHDLVRLAVATMSPPQITPFLLKFKYGGRIIVGLLGVLRDFYKYYGIPVFYYYSFEEKDVNVAEANYIIVSTMDDKIEFSRHSKPGVSIPLVELAEKPSFIPEDL